MVYDSWSPDGGDVGTAHLVIEISTDTVAADARLAGELDMLTASRLQFTLEQLLRDGYHDVRIDLSRLEFISCAGINVLARASAQYQKAGGQLTLAHASRATLRILRITGLDTVLRTA